MAFSDPIIVHHDGTDVRLDISLIYPNNKTQRCIQAWTDDGPWATFTVCIPGVSLKSGQTILDTNNEPEILGVLESAGIVKDTGIKAASGYCEYPVVELTSEINAYLENK